MAVLLSGELVNKIARFVATVVLARNLSLEDYGLVNVGIAVAGIGALATSLGLPDVGARDAAVEPARSAQIAGTVLTGRSASLLVLSALGLVAVLALDPGALSIALMAVAMALGLALSLDWLLRGREQMGAVAASAGAGGLAVLLGAVLVLPASPTPVLGLALFAFAEFVATAATWALALNRLPPLRLAGLRPLVRRAWPVGASAFVIYLYSANLDTILLSAIRSAEEAGLYSAAYRLYFSLNVVGTFAAYALLPTLARSHTARESNSGHVPPDARATLLPLAAYGIGCVAVAELAAGPLLSGLFGPSFEQMRATLVLLTVAVPLYCVAYPAGYALVASDRGRQFLTGATAAGVVNLGLNLVLIPGIGPPGAAISTISAMLVAGVIWLRAQRLITRDLFFLYAALAVAGCGAIVAAASSSLTVPIGLLTITLAGGLTIRTRGAEQSRE